MKYQIEKRISEFDLSIRQFCETEWEIVEEGNLDDDFERDEK